MGRPQTGELFNQVVSHQKISRMAGLPEPDPPTFTRRDVKQAGLEMLTEAPVGNKSLDEMTKVELEALGRQHGIELDRRKRKNVLVETMKDLLERLSKGINFYLDT